VLHTSDHSFVPTKSLGEVSAILLRPDAAKSLYVFAHGAGAGMRHSFMEAVSYRLASRRIATFRFQFPYMEVERKVPDPAPVLVDCVRSAVNEASRLVPDIPLVAGGKSMGGRMTSTAASRGFLPDVLGLAFFGFPLHPPGGTSTERADHLAHVNLPMLFLQGTRDRLADLKLLTPLLADLKPCPTVHVVHDMDHGFHVAKRTGRTNEEVLDEVCDGFCHWCDRVVRS
ncbi:uncharacterized protein METZ01_LOCUS223126, partial [marine metagenome]